jgi:membrane-associated phospholipid phosphatase
MKDFIDNNKYYLIPFLLLMLSGLFFLFFNNKGEELAFFSANRTAFMNTFFKIANYLGEASIFILCILIFLLFKLWKKSIPVLLCGIFSIICSHFFKHFFGYPRPAIYFLETLKRPELLQPVPGVELVSSYTTSFPSGHATAAFALYGILAFIIHRPLYIKQLFLLPAMLAGTARIYLGQHFLSDVLAGALLGTSIAIIVYIFDSRIQVIIANRFIQSATK